MILKQQQQQQNKTNNSTQHNQQQQDQNHSNIPALQPAAHGNLAIEAALYIGKRPRN
jgi:hypothetical protein